MASQDTNAIVLQRVEVAPGLMILRVAPDGWELPEFTPGQFNVLGMPGTAPRCELSDAEENLKDPEKLLKRAYSIASSSVAKEFLEFYITLVRSGGLTPRLFALGPGDRVFLGEKITGRFTLEEVPEDQNLLLIGTGTGLAPYMSMIRTVLPKRLDRRITVVHGARHSWDLGYRAELNTMARLAPNLTYIPVITRPAEETVPWNGLSGYLQDLWRDGSLSAAIGETPRPEDTHVFLCGSPAMIEGAVEALAEDGFVEHTRKQDGQVHVERYW